MNIAIVGNRTFPLETGAGYIFYLIRQMDPEDILIVRPSEGVDYLARLMAETRGIEVRVFHAPPNHNFYRDEQLVMEADRVEAFFGPDTIMEGGTGHIVMTALRMDKTVRAWTVEDDMLTLVGSHGDVH